MENPEFETSPRGQKIKEISDAILINEDPTSNLFNNSARDVPLKYLAGELLWYFLVEMILNLFLVFLHFGLKLQILMELVIQLMVIFYL